MMRELAVGLSRKGWAVTVITGFPNHPGGEVFGGYEKRWLLEETDCGVRVVRVWLATSNSRSLVSRLLTFATFTITASWRALRLGKTDVVFAVLQPLSMGVMLPLVARIKRAALVFNVQDLHPQTQIELGLVRSKVLIWLLQRIERYGYTAAQRLTVICRPFARHCQSLGVPADKIRVIANWIDTARILPIQSDNPFRRRVAPSGVEFVALWAGTLGHVCGAEAVVECARLLQDSRGVRFVVVGEGPAKARLISLAASQGLTNIEFLPFQPEGDLQSVLAAADACLVTLDPRFAESSVPSKVLAYMAAGRAIVALVPEQSETARTLLDAACAKIISNGDIPGMAEAIRGLQESPALAANLGRSARQYAEVELSMTLGVKKYEALFLDLVGWKHGCN